MRLGVRYGCTNWPFLHPCDVGHTWPGNAAGNVCPALTESCQRLRKGDFLFMSCENEAFELCRGRRSIATLGRDSNEPGLRMKVRPGLVRSKMQIVEAISLFLSVMKVKRVLPRLVPSTKSMTVGGMTWSLPSQWLYDARTNGSISTDAGALAPMGLTDHQSSICLKAPSLCHCL